jgi:hypothetical protein
MRRVVIEKQGRDWVAGINGQEIARGRFQGGVADAAHAWARWHATMAAPISVLLHGEYGISGCTYPNGDPTLPPRPRR